jgi:hypothetical protein
MLHTLKFLYADFHTSLKGFLKIYFKFNGVLLWIMIFCNFFLKLANLGCF